MELYPYQKEGVRFLWEIESGILGFEQGLGKTITSLAYTRLHQKKGMTSALVVVTDTTLLSNWKNEIKEFWPAAKMLLYHGANRKLEEGFNIYVTTYGTLKVNESEFRQFFSGKKWDMICDEYQKLGNSETKVTKSIENLKPTYLVGLTGTPVNKPEKAYSLVKLVNPGLAGEEDEWRRRFCITEDRTMRVRKRDRFGEYYWFDVTKPTIVGYRTENLPAMHKILNRVMLRKTKKEVASYLPSKQVIKIPYTLDESKVRYKHVLNSMDELVEGLPPPQALQKLQMVLSGTDPNHDDPTTDPRWVGSDKFKVLMDLLPDMSGRIIIWCKYVAVVNHLSRLLADQKFDVFSFTGTHSKAQRDKQIAGWKKNYDAILVTTIKAAGTGLNLVESNTAIFYESEYSASENEQAEDRIHRIGQKNPCKLYYLYGVNTIEQGILNLVQSKARVSDAVVNGRLDKSTMINIQRSTFGVGRFDYED